MISATKIDYDMIKKNIGYEYSVGRNKCIWKLTMCTVSQMIIYAK